MKANYGEIKIIEMDKPEKGFIWTNTRYLRIYACFMNRNISIAEYKN